MSVCHASISPRLWSMVSMGVESHTVRYSTVWYCNKASVAAINLSRSCMCFLILVQKQKITRIIKDFRIANNMSPIEFIQQQSEWPV